MVMASLLTSRVVFIRMCYSRLDITNRNLSDVYPVAIISVGVMGILAFVTIIRLVYRISRYRVRRNLYQIDCM